MDIKCRFFDYNRGVYFSTQQLYTCGTRTARINEPKQKINSFIGTHIAGRTNNDVKMVYIYNSPIEYFPRGLQKHFPNITHLFIHYCKVKEITPEDLIGLEGLIGLRIRFCALHSLPDNLFKKMPMLKEVYFDQNQIQFASSKMLQPFVARENVKFSLLHNTNINAEFARNKPGAMKTIQELMKEIDQKCQKPVESNHCVAEPDSFDPLIKDLWTSGQFSDFTIISGGKEFKVNKTVLGLKCSVIAKIIEEHTEAVEMKIHDFTPIAVEALLHFLYTGELQDEQNAAENFLIATKFEIAQMKLAYEKILCENLTEANALENFELAHRNSANYLKEESFKVIAKMFPEDIPKELMENPEHLKKLIDARQLYLQLLRKPSASV